MRILLGILYLFDVIIFLHAASGQSKSLSPIVLGPTIVDSKSFNADDDVNKLVTAMTWTTERQYPDYRTIIELLGSRTYSQRMKIAQAYANKNKGQYLPDKLYSATRHKLHDDIPSYLFKTDMEILANMIAYAFSKSHDWAYMSILCTSAKERLTALNNFKYLDYENRKNLTLSEAIDKGMTQKKGKAVLQYLIKPNPDLRPEGGFDKSKVKDQIALLPRKEEDCDPNNEALMKLMTKESFDQIQAVDQQYRIDNNGSTVLQLIDSVCKLDVREAYRRIVSYAVGRFGYFSYEFYQGKNDYNHGWVYYGIDIVVFTRCEIDLKDIEEAYRIGYNRTLLSDIQDWNKPDDNDAAQNYLRYVLLKGNN